MIVADGTAHFIGLGEAAVVVYINDVELDRMTWTAFEADSIVLQVYPSIVASDDVSWTSKKAYTLDWSRAMNTRAFLGEPDRKTYVDGAPMKITK